MRSRRLIGIVALLGVLVHAGALVRHNGMMLGALLQYQGLVADLTAMCHGSGTPADADLPFLPRPTGAEFGCPICSGVVAAFALAPVEVAEIAPRLPGAHRQPPRLTASASVERLGLPPGRGPPALA
jgi:hypothetical protein